MDSTSIGLDIGASAVRAAEISVGRDGRSLRRYAQIGLPRGAVVDGEVINVQAVSEALRRLWTDGGFTRKKVVLGVSGHRVIVRQADVPALNEEDLRSSLKFDAQELIPIPMEDASFDFRILERKAEADADGKSAMRILLVAAHRDLLQPHLAALKGAGLEAVAIDATPLALMRVVPPAPVGPDGVGPIEALVSIGAEITTVAVREGPHPKFIRSLAVGGSKLTAEIANTARLEPLVAERLKRSMTPDLAARYGQARQVLSSELRDLAEEVTATIDFFTAQAGEGSVKVLRVTGGASQTQGLVEALAGSGNVETQRIDPLAGMDVDGCGLTADDLERARAGAATAIGLALWTSDGPEWRLNVLPEEVAAARRARRITGLAGVAVAGVAGVLAVSGVHQILQVHRAQDQVTAAQEQVASLQAQVGHMQAQTSVHGKVASRAALQANAVTGEIDWVRLLAQLASVMPSNVTITTFTGSGTSPATGSSSSSSSSSNSASGGAAPVKAGSATFSVTGSGGLPTAAAWLEGLQRDPSFSGVWVSGITVAGNAGTVTFSSAGDLTTAAESNRAQKVKK